jgi:hypothetical protein
MRRPLAGAEAPGEVVGVFSRDRTAAGDYRPFSYPGFSDLRDAGGPFAHLAGHSRRRSFRRAGLLAFFR